MNPITAFLTLALVAVGAAAGYWVNPYLDSCYSWPQPSSRFR
jgi:hypothetical protein